MAQGVKQSTPKWARKQGGSGVACAQTSLSAHGMVLCALPVSLPLQIPPSPPNTPQAETSFHNNLPADSKLAITGIQSLHTSNGNPVHASSMDISQRFTGSMMLPLGWHGALGWHAMVLMFQP